MFCKDPVLFLLFINDVSLVFKKSRFMFCFCFLRFVNSFDDHLLLQQDLVLFVQWCHCNDLEVNIPKCKVVKLSKNKLEYSFLIMLLTTVRLI